jgi:pSer/pThr/pTyr-binding forkhead associated (FHA) protein
MAKLIVTLEGKELQQCAIGIDPVSIGRLPENAIVIGNSSVSGRHAMVSREGGHIVVQDLRSTNGTFVNHKPIVRHTLAEGDVVQIGRHSLIFTERVDGDTPSPTRPDRPLSDSNGADQPLLPGPERGRPSQVYDAVVAKTSIPSTKGRIGTIKVRSGKTDQGDYLLTSVTTMIGSDTSAQIRMTGWFKPKNAAAVSRDGDRFSITPMGGAVSVNGRAISDVTELASGDRIDVSGIVLDFRLS